MRILDLVWTVGAGVLAAVGAALIWARRRRLRPPSTGWLTDGMVQQIISRGRIEGEAVPEGPLDLEEIRREEDRFWGETWDAPEPHAD